MRLLICVAVLGSVIPLSGCTKPPEAQGRDSNVGYEVDEEYYLVRTLEMSYAAWPKGAKDQRTFNEATKDLRHQLRFFATFSG